jgi:hypothetical protein
MVSTSTDLCSDRAMVTQLGTTPKGHFNSRAKGRGHGVGTKWARDGHEPRNDKGLLAEALDFAGCGGTEGLGHCSHREQ